MNLRPRGLNARSSTGGTRPPLTTLVVVGSALAVVAALATIGGEDAASAAPEGERAPVERTALVCPPPPEAHSLTTWYTGYTPDDGSLAGDQQPGIAGLLPLAEHVPGESFTEDDEDDEDDQAGAADEDDGEDSSGAAPEDLLLPLEEPGQPVTDSTRKSEAPALGGTAEHRLAPGWTVQQTSLVNAESGTGRGLLGTSCQRPDTTFWFAGSSTIEDRGDYLHLINPDTAATVVDIELYGPDGRLELTIDEGVTVPPSSSVAVRIATLTSAEEHNLALRASARSGRIGAQIQVTDEKLGADWLPPVAGSQADGTVVLPGIPADATAVRLAAFTPGDRDLSLDIQFIGPTSTITPVGHESIYLRAGMVEAVDLDNLTQGEPGALLLTPSDGEGDVKAALRVLQGEDDEREMAFIPGAAPIERQASVSGNDPGRAELALTAPGDDVEVEVVASPGADAGTAITENHTVPGGTTLVLEPDIPEDTEGRYAITVRRTGGGELYAARTLAVERDDIPMFTVQPLSDDASTVAVPETGQNPGIISHR